MPVSPVISSPEDENELTGDGQQTYEVEKLVSKRKVGRGYQYNVKWAGCPDSENQWRPRSALHPDLIAEFYPPSDSESDNNVSDRATDVPPTEIKTSIDVTDQAVTVDDDELPPDEVKTIDGPRRSSRLAQYTPITGEIGTGRTNVTQLESIDALFTT